MTMDYLDHLKIAARLDSLELENQHMRYALAQKSVYEAGIERAERERQGLLAAVETAEELQRAEDEWTQDGTDQG